MAKCWENSKYVSNCVESNEAQCLCEDAEFQSVRNPSSHSSALLRNSRWYSNVSTLSARLLNSDPPSTKLSRHVLILGLIPLMPLLLLSFVTKLYANVEAQAVAMYQVIFLRQPSTP